MPSFYKDVSLWDFPTNCLPTNDDVVRFYVSRIKLNKDKQTSKLELGKLVNRIWESADCCPIAHRHIVIKFEELFQIYKEYHLNGREKRSHKRQNPRTPSPPTRKSSRLHGGEISEPVPSQSESSAVTVAEQAPSISTSKKRETSPKTPPKRSASVRHEGEHIHKQAWLEDYGNHLFDVVSRQRLSKIANATSQEDTETFDSEYYNDQKNPSQRTHFIEVMKVTKEYYDEQKARQKTQGAKYARHLSAYGLASDAQQQEDTRDAQAETSSSGESSQTEDDTAYRTSEHPSSIVTRSGRRSTEDTPGFSDTMMYIGGQDFQSISTRSKKGSRMCHPAYLQSGLMMMALGNESSNQAVLNMFIHDTVVYGQQRRLPLRLQKEYQRALKRMKRYLASVEDNERDQPVMDQLIPRDSGVLTDNPESEEEIEDETTIAHENDDLQTIVVETREQGKESKAVKFVKETKLKQNECLDLVLPDPRSVRDAHRVASSFLEGQIGVAMVKNKSNYLMPDGTSRAKVGKMGGALVHISGKVRALKMQIMGSDTRENWADTLIFKLERLAKASEHSVQELYESIRGLVSDAASVNKGLAKEMSAKLGLEWIPDQIYCCIHTVLGFQDGMVSLWMQYQTKIGSDKMYPSITGFELDMEEKCLIKQILECFMRLTADRWQARSWNRFEAFTQYAKDHGKFNLGVELHGNRFGDLEKCCAIGVYSLELWLNFVNVRTDIRNNLAIFLRDTQHLSDICTVLWLGPALLGIHLTEPYLALLLEEQVTHLDLLRILPQLYKELNEYQISLAQINEPAFPSLKNGWIDPLSPFSPYQKEISESIQRSIARQDMVLLDKYLKELCKGMATILKRQRGKNSNKIRDVKYVRGFPGKEKSNGKRFFNRVKYS